MALLLVLRSRRLPRHPAALIFCSLQVLFLLFSTFFFVSSRNKLVKETNYPKPRGRAHGAQKKTFGARSHQTQCPAEGPINIGLKLIKFSAKV